MTLPLFFLLLMFRVDELMSHKDVSISHPTVLLPFHYPEKPINFTIHLSTGCAKWSSSRSNAVKLFTAEGEINSPSSVGSTCLPTITLSAVHKERQRIFSVVQADIKYGGTALVSDVEVNTITKISIVTTTKILYIGFPYTLFSVHAFDENGNFFTTIEGIPFIWRVLPDETSLFPDHTGHNVLRILKWSDVSNEPSPPIAALEKSGLKGSSVVISGIKIGVAYIETEISSPVYPDVAADRVRVIVKDFLILQPSGFVAILVDQVLNIETFNMNFNQRSQLILPTDSYWLSLNKKDHLQLYSEESAVKGLSLGETAVCIASTIPNDDSGPCVDVLVTEPHYAIFQSEPDHDWLLEVGLQYEVSIFFYDKNDNLIHPEALVAETKHESQFVRLEYISKNGTFLRVTPLVVGQSHFLTQLKAVTGYKGERVILSTKFQVSKKEEFKIIEPISVIPKRLGFIWTPEQQKSHIYQLKATGGSGVYKWESDNVRIVSVTKSGLIETTGTPGLATITVTDRQMSRHFDTSKVYVGPPVKILLQPYYVESQINTELLLPIRIFVAEDPLIPEHLFEVADCVGLKFHVTFTNKEVFQYVSTANPQTEPYNVGCALLKFNTTGVGFTQVSVGIQNIVNKTTLAGYDKMGFKDYTDLVVMSLGSSIDLTSQGGLLPWEPDPSKFYRDPKVSDATILTQLKRKEHVNRHDHNIFTVFCNKIGESEFLIVTGNNPSYQNQHPRSSSTKIIVKCSYPASVKLVPNPIIPDCPPYKSLHSESLPVLAGNPQSLSIVARDVAGNDFINMSSLEYSVSGCLKNSKSGVLDVKNFPMVIITVMEPMDCVLDFIFTGYKKPFAHEKVDSVSASLKISAKNNPKLEMSELSLFNHPTNVKNVGITGGSGYFNFMSKARQGSISDVTFDAKLSILSVSPLTDGQEMLSINDLCFPMSPQMQLEIIVSSIGTINVKTKRVMQLNSSDVLEVQVVDSNGWNIESKMFPVINLTLITNNEVVAFKPLEESKVTQNNKYSKFYKMFARQVGTLQLHFTATLTSGLISSQFYDIQVFNPLAVVPKVVYMLVGQYHQIKTTGGPQPLPTLLYHLDDDTIGKMSPSGLFEAKKVGSCVANVKIIDNNDYNILSNAMVQFHVVELNSVEVRVALSSFPTESIIPVHVTGNNGKLSPLTMNLGLNFDWSVGSNDVVKIIPQHEYSGISMDREANFAIRLLALNAGSSVVKVSVSCNSPQAKCFFAQGRKVLTAEADLNVFKKLELLEPLNVKLQNKLIMTPKASTFIKPNLNFVTYEVLHESERNLVSIDYKGQVISGSNEGVCVLLVKSTEENGVNQTLNLLVEVKPISFIRIQTGRIHDSPKTASETAMMTLVPQGMTLNLRVSFHDNQAYAFHAVNTQLKYELNRYDIAQLNQGSVNNSLIFRNSDQGISALKVWIPSTATGSKGLTDYLAFHVGNVIRFDRKQIVEVGDIISFEAPFGENSDVTWSTTSNLLSFDAKVPGVALALGAGNADVMVSVGKQKTHTSVFVINSLPLKINTEHVKTVLYPSSTPFLFNLGKKIICPDHSKLESYKPDVSWLRCSTWFDSHAAHLNTQIVSRPVFSPQDGFSCEIRIDQTKPDTKKALATLSSPINFQVTILPSANRLSVSSEITRLTFAPNFYISSNSVILSNHYPSVEVVIEANSDVIKKLEVVPKTHNLFTLTKLVQQDSMKVSIDLLPSAFSRNSGSETSQIEVRCGLSGYSEVINAYVQWSPHGSDTAVGKSGFLHGYLDDKLFFYVPIVITLIFVLIGYYITLVYKQQNKLIDLSITEANVLKANSPMRPRILNDSNFLGGGDGLFDRSVNYGAPGSTPYPNFARMRRNTNSNRSPPQSMDDSLMAGSCGFSGPSTPWSSSNRPASPGRVQLWSQTSDSPNDATRGS